MILETLHQSVQTVFANKIRLVKALLIPFIVTYLLRSLKVSIAGSEIYEEVIVFVGLFRFYFYFKP